MRKSDLIYCKTTHLLDFSPSVSSQGSRDQSVARHCLLLCWGEREREGEGEKESTGVALVRFSKRLKIIEIEAKFLFSWERKKNSTQGKK